MHTDQIACRTCPLNFTATQHSDMTEQAYVIVFQKLPRLAFSDIATQETVFKKAQFLSLKTTDQCG